jgi:alpha-tubulin suppressor-like RCC1 family protein
MPASDNPHGSRAACAGAGSVCYGSCNGVDTDGCEYPNGSCGTNSCANGLYTPPGACVFGTCQATPTACADGLCGISNCTTVLQTTAGGDFVCALLADGTVRCWGGNDYGVLGYDPFNFPSSLTPTPMPNIGGVIAIGAGSGHMCAVLASGAVECWGGNGDGQLGNGFTDGNPHPSPVPVCLSGAGVGCTPLTNATAVFGGATDSCAIANGGHVYCWGNNVMGQVGAAPSSRMPNPVEVCAVGGCGGGFIGDASPIKQVAIGFTHTMALDQAGNVYCWGTNNNGVCGLDCGAISSTPTVIVGGVAIGPQKPIYIASGELTSYAVISDGTTANNLVRAWGNGNDGERGDDTVANTCVSPQPVSTVCTTAGCATHLTGATAVGVAYLTACAVANGAVSCWGPNDHGELGNGTVGSSGSFVKIATPALLTSNAVDVIGQSYSSTSFCARVQNASVRCWGDNRYGQLGLGAVASAPSPSPSTPHW